MSTITIPIPDYSVIWLLYEEKPRLIASKWILKISDDEIYCFLPPDDCKIKLNSDVFKLREVGKAWCRKLITKIKYQTGIKFNFIYCVCFN